MFLNFCVFTDLSLQKPYDANETSLYVELVIVVDHDMYIWLDKNVEKVHKYCKDVVNIVNSVKRNLKKIFFKEEYKIKK